jgi:predicted nucleic acid-binding protein
VILVDTSIWADHLRTGSVRLAALLDDGQVLMHPFVRGELALGHLRQHNLILATLADLPQVRTATDLEVLDFIELHGLAGRGIGYVDAHLLAAVRLTEDASLWTRDKRLHAAANRLNLATV